MRHIRCRRHEQYGIGRGQTARRLVILNGSGAVRSEPVWRRQLIMAAHDEDPHVRLWAAVLEDAITALRGRHSGGYLVWNAGRVHAHPRLASPEALWREATAWVLSRDEEPLGTFESVCVVLGLDAGEVRRDLVQVATKFRRPAATVAEVPPA